MVAAHSLFSSGGVFAEKRTTLCCAPSFKKWHQHWHGGKEKKNCQKVKVALWHCCDFENLFKKFMSGIGDEEPFTPDFGNGVMALLCSIIK